MFFERFDLWGEEILGLLSGISFVLLGALIYVLYRINIGVITYVPLVLMMISSGGIAYLFQLPRLKNTRSGVATLLGGLMIGVTIVFYAIIGALESGRKMVDTVIVWGTGAAIMVLSFFAVGFLLLAVYPEGGHLESADVGRRSEKSPKEDKKENHREEEEDFLDRIERL